MPQKIHTSLVSDSACQIISNTKIDEKKLANAQSIILGLYKDLSRLKSKGSGAFMAAIYDQNGKLIVKIANSVVAENCSLNHAEINAIKAAEKILGTFDLSAYNLSLYSSAEPCLMCQGAIYWAGIKEVYYGVPLDIVQVIRDEDQGPRTNWVDEFKKRNILVCGGIAIKEGAKVLQSYCNKKTKIK